MATVRESWTDERLDAFSERVDWRMERFETRMDRLETRMDEGFKELRGEIGAFQRAMILALVALFVSQMGLIATQL